MLPGKSGRLGSGTASTYIAHWSQSDNTIWLAQAKAEVSHCARLASSQLGYSNLEDRSPPGCDRKSLHVGAVFKGCNAPLYGEILGCLARERQMQKRQMMMHLSHLHHLLLTTAQIYCRNTFVTTSRSLY